MLLFAFSTFISILILEKVAKIHLCSHALTLLNNKGQMDFKNVNTCRRLLCQCLSN